jgi:hypothetical protein
MKLYFHFVLDQVRSKSRREKDTEKKKKKLKTAD